jgi:DNA-binding CsgD family transcriptional regulator
MTGKVLMAFHRAVRRVHATRQVAELSPNLLAALREIIPADIVLADWNRCRLDGLRTTYDPAGTITPEVHQAVHLHLHDHPAYGHRRREATSISDHLSRARWEKTALYCDGYGRVGQRDGLAIDVEFGDGCMLSLVTTRGRRGFNEMERLGLTLLRAHVEDVYRRLASATGQGVWLEVTRDGRIAAAPDEAAQALLERHFLGAAAGGTLSPDLARWVALAGARLNAVISAPVLPGAGPLRASLAPSTTDPEKFHLYLEEPAARAIRVTLREGEVLDWLREGKTNGEIALLLGIRPGTVKRHLENLYAKLGVENRHAAARWRERPQ